MANASFAIDTKPLRDIALKYKDNGPAVKVLQRELTTGFIDAGNAVLDAGNALIQHKSHALAKSGTVKTTVGAKAIQSVIRWTAKYAGWVNDGRGPVFAKPGHVLRFVIDGKVFFRNHVGPAKAQHFAERGLEVAKPKIQGYLTAAVARFADWANRSL